MSEREQSQVIVCSFYTEDEYYSAHAKKLIENLDKIGVLHQITVMEKKPGEDWADICRKKVGFLAKVCSEHPDKKVFWIDVDCELLEIPEFIVRSTADIIGFQRSFGSPLSIGYQNRTRFWEPCFWGVNNTRQGRKMIEDAYALEQNSTIKATDDYFFEEGWRANASNLTFQLIPSNSGSLKKRIRKRLLSLAKKIHRILPAGLRKKARRVVDKTGITGALTQDAHNGLVTPDAKSIVEFARNGATGEVNEAFDAFRRGKIPTSAENRMISAALSFLNYATSPSDTSIKLAWWSQPYPGNFGDWLSPYLLQKYSRSRIEFQPLHQPTKAPHIVAVGSIGRFIGRNSIVVGTGVSSLEYPLEPQAKYFSLRGPRSAALLAESGGPVVDSFGDPALLISRIYPVIRGETNGKVAFIRHHSHRALPIKLPEHFEELNVLRSHSAQIEELLIGLNHYEAVVTSAMHVFIVCQSYGIPVALVTFKGFEESVHGDGIKYIDYCEGAGVPTVTPTSIPLDLRKLSLENLMTNEKIGDEKLNEVEISLVNAIEEYLTTSPKIAVR